MQAAMAWESKASPLAVTQSFSSACMMSSLKGMLRSQAWSSSRRGFHAACLLRARIVVFIAMTSAATMRLRSPDPASESYPPGFELGSPVKKARASVRPLSTRLSPSSRFTATMRSGSAIPGHQAFFGACPGQRLAEGRPRAVRRSGRVSRRPTCRAHRGLPLPSTARCGSP
jgi:hypothetical protein